MGFSDQIDEFNQQVSDAVNKVIRDYQEKVAEELKLRNEEALRHLSEIQPKVSSSLLSEGMERLASSAKKEGSGTSDQLLTAVQHLNQAADQVSILKALLKGARQFAERSAFLLIKDGGIEGWAASGFDEEISSLEGVTIPSSKGWNRLLTGQGLVELSASDCGILCATYDAPLPTEGIAIPFVLDGKLAAALYADGDENLDAASLQVLTHVASQALHFTPVHPSILSPTLSLWTEEAAPLEAWTGTAVAPEAEVSTAPAMPEEAPAAQAEEIVEAEPEGTQLVEMPVVDADEAIEPLATLPEAEEIVPQEVEEEAFDEVEIPEIEVVDVEPGESEAEVEEFESEEVPVEAEEADKEETLAEAEEVEAAEPLVMSSEYAVTIESEEEEPPSEAPILADEAVIEEIAEVVDADEVVDAAEILEAEIGDSMESAYDPITTEAIVEGAAEPSALEAELEAFEVVEAEPAPEIEADTIMEEEAAVEPEAEPIEAFQFQPPPELEVEETPESSENTVRVSREMLEQYANLEPPAEEPAIPQSTVQIPTFQAPIEPEVAEEVEELPEDVTEEVEIPSLETAPWETPAVSELPPELDEVDLAEDATILLGQTVLPSPPSLGEPAPSTAPPTLEPEPVASPLETEPVAPTAPPEPEIPQLTPEPSVDEDDTNPTISRVQTKVIGGQVLPPADLGDRPGLAFQASSGASSDTAIHDKARRLARLLVSEIKLYHEDQVEEGRRHFDIYDRLKDDIDRSRHNYEDRVDPRAKSIDHFYEALVKVLANGDPSALGM